MELMMWDEKVSLEEAFEKKLQNKTSIDFILRELGKRIFLEKSLSEYKIQITAEEQKSLIDKFRNGLRLTDDQAFTNFLQKIGSSESDFIVQITYQECLNKLKVTLFDQQALKENFLKRKQEFDRVLFSLIKVEGEDLAKEIYHQIQDDAADFAQQAKKYSTGETAKKGGLIGPLSVKSVNPEMMNRLITKKPGELVEPFTLNQKDYYILRMNRLVNAELTPQLQSNLRNQLFESWINRQVNLGKIRLI